MAAISQKTFSWMKVFEFRMKFRWNLLGEGRGMGVKVNELENDVVHKIAAILLFTFQFAKPRPNM